jgi:hypothetical protein
MPKSASYSKLKETIKGDINLLQDEQMRTAFPNAIKGAGADVAPSRYLPFRRERMVGDGGEGVMSPLSCREVPKDEVV